MGFGIQWKRQKWLTNSGWLLCMDSKKRVRWPLLFVPLCNWAQEKKDLEPWTFWFPTKIKTYWWRQVFLQMLLILEQANGSSAGQMEARTFIHFFILYNYNYLFTPFNIRKECRETDLMAEYFVWVQRTHWRLSWLAAVLHPILMVKLMSGC